MIDDDPDVPQLTENRRLHDRSRLIIDVSFEGTDATGVASTKDISVGGLYMNTQANLPAGSLLMIRIPLRESEPLVIKAEVIYTDEGRGVGLRFHELSSEDRSRLEREIANP